MDPCEAVVLVILLLPAPVLEKQGGDDVVVPHTRLWPCVKLNADDVFGMRNNIPMDIMFITIISV
jgi:hypothetical protein